MSGQDGYRMQKRLEAIEERHRAVSPVSVHKEEWEGAEVDVEHLKRILRSPSIFREKRLLILKNAAEQPSFTAFLEEWGDQIKKDEDTILVLAQDTLPKAVSSLVSRYAALTEEFPPLKGKELEAWTGQRLNASGVRASASLVRRLQACCSSDLWKIEQEIGKLAAYGKERELTEEALDILLPLPGETKIFSTLDAISAKDGKRAMHMLREHNLAGDADFYVLAMMQYQVRNLLAVKEDEEKTSSSAKKLVSPRILPQLQRLARGFRLSELKALHRALWKIDLAAKKGERDVYQALEILVAKITHSPS